MQATSAMQYDAFRRAEAPPLDEVADGVWCIANSMRTNLMSLTATLCYVLEDAAGALHVIDPGTDHDEGMAQLDEGFALLGRRAEDVASVIVTHMHPDHAGLAARLCARSGAPMVVSAQEREGFLAPVQPIGEDTLVRWGVPRERWDEVAGMRPAGITPATIPDDIVLVAGGDLLDIPGREVRVIDTPGHTTGSISLHAPREELLFAGDTLLPLIHPGIGLGGRAENPVADYLTSLRDLARFGDLEVCPGHEYRFRGLAERAEATVQHHLRRSRGVAELEDAGHEHSVWGIARRLHWTAGFDNLRGHMLRSALRQTEMHLAFVRSGVAAAFLA